METAGGFEHEAKSARMVSINSILCGVMIRNMCSNVYVFFMGLSEKDTKGVERRAMIGLLETGFKSGDERKGVGALFRPPRTGLIYYEIYEIHRAFYCGTCDYETLPERSAISDCVETPDPRGRRSRSRSQI